MMPTFKRVKATREGLRGRTTASGYRIDSLVPFVALPAQRALWRAVVLRNPANGKLADALVLDIGPWDINDDDYVFGSARPRAESGTDQYGRHTNGAGIDIGEHVRAQLGLVADSADIEWAFAADWARVGTGVAVAQG